mgnify:FL=1
MNKFLKMHGVGNDFIVLDGRDKINFSSKIAKEISNRRTGVGCDQIIIILNSNKGCDVKLLFFNADGSEAQACGNGTRCVSKLIMNETSKDSLKIETLSGFVQAWKNKLDNLIVVDMGIPKFLWNEIPLSKQVNNENVDLGEFSPSKAFCLSMGNPHAVIFVDELENYKLEEFGSKLEKHSIFSQGANISLVQIYNERKIKIKVWERGVGITMACGTAACASVVAGKKKKILSDSCEVNLDGGKLFVEINKENHILLKGPTEISFEGFLTERLKNLFN